MIYIIDFKKSGGCPDSILDPTAGNIFPYLDFEYIATNFLFPEAKDLYIRSMCTEDFGCDENEYLTIDELENILDRNKNIKIFGINTDTIKGTDLTKKEISLTSIAEKYYNVFFIFFDNETYFQVRKEILPNVFYIANNFPFDAEDVLPYYLVNSFQNENIKAMNSLYRSQADLRKCKKYNFFNGIHKPHRLVGYDLIVKNNLLEDGFFSYLDYTNFTKTQEYFHEEARWFDMSLDDYKNHVSSFEIPYHNDTYHANDQPGIYPYPFITPPIYSWQSYISITAETNYESGNLISVSEKSFKAFSGFNIPLIYGQTRLNEYLSNNGFDMFGDLFDITPVSNKSDMISQLDRNLKIIKNMSLKELHNFYIDNVTRIFRNYENLMHIQKRNYFEQIHTKIERLGPRYRI